MTTTYESLQLKHAQLVKKLQTAKARLTANEADYHQAQRFFEKENADVEQLEKQSLSSFLRNLIGTYERKLDKEKQERVEAKVYLDRTSALFLEAREEYTSLTEKIRRIQFELSELKSNMVETDTTFHEKVSKEKQKRLKWIEESREIDEAIDAGVSVINAIDASLDKLQSADSLATWDLFADSLIIDFMKYNHIDKAEEELAFLEALIDRYRKELKDVDLEAVLDYEQLGNMRRFFDVFFDNIFSDLDTKQTIKRNKEMLENIYYEVQTIQKQLAHRKSELNKQINDSEFYY